MSEYASRGYARLLPREVLLVLELDGSAYQLALVNARQQPQYERELAVKNEDKPEFADRKLLEPLLRPDVGGLTHSPRYVATAKFGRRLEPWITQMSQT